MKKIYLYIQLLFLVCTTLQAQQTADFDAAYIDEMKAENKALSERIAQQPSAFRTANDKIKTALGNKDYLEALSIALEMEKQYPGNADLKNFVGKMYLATGDKQKAIKAFNKALILNPGNKWFYINKATAQAESNALQEALHTISKLNSQYPKWSIGYNLKAALLVALNRTDDALKAYAEAVTSSPASAQILTNRGDLYLQLGDMQKALQDYNAALIVQPDYKRAQLKRNEAQTTTSKKE